MRCVCIKFDVNYYDSEGYFNNFGCEYQIDWESLIYLNMKISILLKESHKNSQKYTTIFF